MRCNCMTDHLLDTLSADSKRLETTPDFFGLDSERNLFTLMLYQSTPFYRGRPLGAVAKMCL